MPSAVWLAGAMGLLDDAIREHLDLKRRNGGDPGELARKENEALAPVLEVGDGPGTGAGDPVPGGQEAADALEAEVAPAEPTEFVEVGEETAELDMEAVLAVPEESGTPDSPSATAERPAGASSSSEAHEEDSLEWELPGDRRAEDGPPAEIPGQERLSFE
jgi:hypothetical protein